MADKPSDTGGLEPTQIGQIGLRVLNLDRAVAFYRDVLGLKYLFSAPPGLAFFDCGGVRLMLSVPQPSEASHPSSILYYKVRDIQAGVAQLKAHDVELLHEPRVIAEMPDHDLWMAFFNDTEGNVLALMCEVPRP